MQIKNVRIENYKCFKDLFNIDLKDGVNILVGDNEAGKSTILEAIHLALTGMLDWRYLRNKISQYLFTREVVEGYLNLLKQGKNTDLPRIQIEVFLRAITVLN